MVPVVMRLSIIINHYKTRELLRLCLYSIHKNVGGEFEIIVRDGEAQDETAQVLREEFPDVLYLPEERNVGFARLVNGGLEVAKGVFLLNINADIVIPEPGSVEALVGYLENHPDVGMVGPKLLNVNDAVQRSAFRFYRPLTLLYRRTFLGKTPWGRRDLARLLMRDVVFRDDTPLPVDWLMGSAMLVSRRAVERVGVLDDRFFMYMEDVDWCRRFWENGFRVIYYPGAAFVHYHIQASRGGRGIFDILANRYTRIHIRSAVRYFMKYGFRVPRYGA